ncbi:MAG: hypothetical protein ACRDL6_03675 [Solirubrobacterales bacterium]
MAEALPLIEACELSPEGARAQGDRYSELSRWTAAIERRPRLLDVRFSREVDRELLEEAIAVERSCCSFLAIDFNPDALALSIGVAEERLAPALDALEWALRGSEHGEQQ